MIWLGIIVVLLIAPAALPFVLCGWLGYWLAMRKVRS
jgi:hypothetical protein